MQIWISEMRLATRSLAHAPGFTLAAAASASLFPESMLFEVSPLDPATLIAAPQASTLPQH